MIDGEHLTLFCRCRRNGGTDLIARIKAVLSRANIHKLVNIQASSFVSGDLMITPCLSSIDVFVHCWATYTQISEDGAGASSCLPLFKNFSDISHCQPLPFLSLSLWCRI